MLPIHVVDVQARFQTCLVSFILHLEKKKV